MSEPVVDFEVPVDRIHISGNSTGQKLTKEAIAESLREHWGEIREEILRLPSQEIGLNMDRVHAFREKIGIPRKEIRVLSPEDYAKVAKVVTGIGIDGQGVYLNQQDIIVVKRDPYQEAINGPELVESFIVHEIAHSSGRNNTIHVDAGFMKERELSFCAYYARLGFRVVRIDGDGKVEGAEGEFLEEGYAELERGIYVAQELGKPDGFGKTAQPTEPNPLTKYRWVGLDAEKNMQWAFAPGAISAMTFEELISRDPELLPALRKGRRSVEGLIEVVRRINAIAPGFYRELRKMDTKATKA